MGSLEGKVAFITGVARGQGQRHAVRLANEGADIIGIDLCGQVESVAYPMATSADLARTVELVEATGRRIVARQGDVRDVASVQKVLQEGLSELGRLDIVLANAGIMPMAGDEAKSAAAWHDAIDIMLSGVFHTLDATIPVLREQGQGGSIVITSSVAGLKSMIMDMDAYTPGMAGYHAAKHGVVGLMRMYARALGREQIRVNTVHPTGVLTPMIDNEAFAAFSEQHPTAVQANTNAMGIHVVEVDDVSSAVVYLASDAGRYVTGVCLPVDAGVMLQ
ncbi:mycofactocin-coupled SDR family oxidoreductase [Streptomyces sp. GQFP]|uniref:mycofactocin-coupled SDR family oxidoreductase n=1 Tax=Streptomyces sp. GQFP TaxID=2907545 RepID=UPI001F3E53C3|nr:mycofactocin-coupled SDR family oxidoreductase [Streptomyces sp. GQFP]UIX29328.1 mycofactocin-coupled SDR family oxidoreductase [Streptomyces sp. GQFP]